MDDLLLSGHSISRSMQPRMDSHSTHAAGLRSIQHRHEHLVEMGLTLAYIYMTLGSMVACPPWAGSAV